MNESEMRKICEVLKTADGGCGECVTELFSELKKAFPWWKKFVTQIYEEWKKDYPYQEELEIINDILEKDEGDDIQ
jgi:hypothetical protein